VQLRELLSFLPLNNGEDPPFRPTSDDPNRMDESLDTIVPPSSDQPYDMRQVVKKPSSTTASSSRSTRASRRTSSSASRASAVASVGIVGNQPNHLAGVLDIKASLKGARFIRFCDAFNIPLVTFEDVPGFLPGKDQEWGGIITHGAKLLYAYCEATVPKITVITRKAYGGAYDVMNSKHIRADLNLAWPSAEIAVMGAEGAAKIVFRREIQAAKDPEGRGEAARRRLQGEVRQPLPGGRARLRRRRHRAAPHAPDADPGARTAAQQARQNPPRKHGNIPL
jgi:propionyl-CoA carboxylase beta chain